MFANFGFFTQVTLNTLPHAFVDTQHACCRVHMVFVDVVPGQRSITLLLHAACTTRAMAMKAWKLSASCAVDQIPMHG